MIFFMRQTYTTCSPLAHAPLDTAADSHFKRTKHNSLQGIGDYAQYPCPAGSFCLVRETDPELCPTGTYRNTTGAASVEDCPLCPGGFQCHEGSVTPDVSSSP